MTLDAAETVLGFFGFNRTAYSNLKNNNDGRRRKEMAAVWRINRESKRHRNWDALILVGKKILVFEYDPYIGLLCCSIII